MKRKYFKRYLISCSLLLSLLFILLIFWGYSSIKSGIHHDEQLNFINQFERTQKNIETSMNISIAIGQLLTESDAITTYASENSDYSSMDFYNIQTIFNSLSSAQTTFANLHLDISLFNEYDSIVITGTKTIDKDDYYEETDILPSDITSAFAKNTRSGYYYRFLSHPSGNNVVYLACQRIYADSSKVYLCISFSQPEISYIPDFYEGKSLLIYGDYTDNTIRRISEKATTITSNVIYKEEIKKGETELVYSALKDMPNIILASEFKYTENLTLFILFLLSLIFGIAFAIACSFVISRLIYKPIQNLMNALTSSDPVDEYGDEVDFIVNFTSQIVETNRTLTMELNKQQNLLRDKFIFDLLNGFVWGDAILQNIEAYGLNFLKQPCIAVLFEEENHFGLSGHYMVQNAKTPESSTIFHTINKSLLENSDGVGITMDNNQYLFILPAKSNNKQMVLNAINAVREETKVQLQAAISTVIQNIDDYKYIYSCLISILEQRYILGGFDILVMDDNSDKANNESNYSIEEEQRLTEYLLSNESEKALLFLNQILVRAFRTNQSKTEMSNFRILMLNSIRRLLYTIGKTQEELFPETDILKRLESCEDNEEFRNSVVSIFKTIAHSIQHDITQRHNEITNRILDYIQENLDKDLSMDDICNEFGMSASTVARRLKERDISFKSYFNDMRIKKAKELMQEHPELMVKDIAAMTGFNNIVSFNRLFKKYEKVSPSQYIENLKR